MERQGKNDFVSEHQRRVLVVRTCARASPSCAAFFQYRMHSCMPKLSSSWATERQAPTLPAFAACTEFQCVLPFKTTFRGLDACYDRYQHPSACCKLKRVVEGTWMRVEVTLSIRRVMGKPVALGKARPPAIFLEKARELAGA